MWSKTSLSAMEVEKVAGHAVGFTVLFLSETREQGGRSRNTLWRKAGTCGFGAPAGISALPLAPIV